LPEESLGEDAVSEKHVYPLPYINRRKFTSQTSDNKGAWKSRGGKSQRREEKRREEKKKEDQRRERVGGKKMEAREKAEKP